MLLFPLLLACSLAFPQVNGTQAITATDQATPQSTESFEERSLVTLSALDDSRKSKQQELQALRKRIGSNHDGAESLDLLEDLRLLQQESAQLDFDFEAVATGIDVRAFNLGPDQDFNLVSELEGLVKPLVSELRSATEAPREMERLRDALTYAKEHLVLARSAVDNLQELITIAEGQTPPDAALTAALRSSQEGWRQRMQDLSNQRTVAQFQLDQRAAKQTSLVDAAQTALGQFVRTRGLNLTIALGVFLLILFILRSAYRGVTLMLRKRSRGERKFYARLIDVLYFAFSGLAGISGALLVLYSAGDWAILGLILLLLLGLAWAGKAAVPLFLEQIRLLLNLGTVREGERLVFQGLPWRVSRLSMTACLTNEELGGGELRLPLRDMTGLHSRATESGERWFPTSKGDWILIDSKCLAKVTCQSTEVVTVQLPGRSSVSYPTLDFLGMSVENLSTGFRAQQRFGIDYEHQGICADKVPALMQAALESKLQAMVGTSQLRKLRVEFLEAAGSSLDYAILADFEGDAAPHYDEINRAMQRFLVETCNEHGWGIPFAQLTLHQATD